MRVLKGLWEEMCGPHGDTCVFQKSTEVTLVLFPLRLNVYFELRHPSNLIKLEYLWINFVCVTQKYLLHFNLLKHQMLGPKY